MIVAQLHKAGNNGPSSWAKGQGARQIKGWGWMRGRGRNTGDVSVPRNRRPHKGQPRSPSREGPFYAIRKAS